MVRSDFYRFVSSDTSLFRGYPRYLHKFSQRVKLWKTSIDRRRPMHSDKVWMHHDLLKRVFKKKKKGQKA